MLKIPIPLFGVKGIRFLARQIRKWPKKLGDKTASLYLSQVVRMQEEIGTGGAGFRFMFGAFLQEARKYWNHPDLFDISKEVTAAGDRWRDFAVMAGRIAKNRASASENYDAASEILLNAADREEKIFKRILGVVG